MRRLYSDDGRYFGQPGLCWDENDWEGISLLLETIWLVFNGNVNDLSRLKIFEWEGREINNDTLGFDLNDTFFMILSSSDT